MARPQAINLDCAAGVSMLPELIADYSALIPQFGLNPHGLTCYAEDARRAILDAERRLLALCGTNDAEAGVIWCATGTEAANLALRGFPWKSETAPLAIDCGAHPALRETARDLTTHPASEFLVSETGDLVPSPPVQSALVALSQVNNETGVMWNADRSTLGSDCAVLLDACQALGKHPLMWSSADLMMLSSRKVGGPATGAALVYRKNLHLKPVITGGGQQGKVRSGTIDVVSILLFVKAAELACAQSQEAYAKVSTLNQELREAINRLGHGNWPIFSPLTASPYICYFAIPGFEGAIIARALAEQYGIIVGTGSACSAESRRTSDLLKAHGVPNDLARGALRVSFSARSTPEELRTLLTALPKVLDAY